MFHIFCSSISVSEVKPNIYLSYIRSICVLILILSRVKLLFNLHNWYFHSYEKSNSIESFGIILLYYQNDLISIFKGKLFACKKVVQSSQQGIYHLNSIFYWRCTQELAWSTSTLFLRFNGQFSSLQTLPRCISHVFGINI